MMAGNLNFSHVEHAEKEVQLRGTHIVRTVEPALQFIPLRVIPPDGQLAVNLEPL
jgi:hypothetical protein